MRYITFISSLFLLNTYLSAQEDFSHKNKIILEPFPNAIFLDTLTFDTTFFVENANRVYTENEHHQIVMEGQYTYELGCYYHGLFMFYYSDGHIKSIGQFYAGDKEGNWVYFYPNGNKQSIINYHYTTNLKNLSVALSSETLPYGDYWIFHENGNIKEKGQYNFFLESAMVPIAFDPETFEPIIGEGKIIISKKSGYIHHYDENGQFIYSDIINVDLESYTPTD